MDGTRAADQLGAQRGDHGAVVGAQPGPGHPQRESGLGAAFRGQRAQPGVRRHPAADDQVPGRHARRQACTALRVSTSATASWKEAATSATGTVRRRAAAPRPSGPRRSSGPRRRSRAVAVVGTCRAGTRSRPGRPPGPPGRSAGRRGRAGPAPAPPCRRPRRPRRRWWRPSEVTSCGHVGHQQQRGVAAGDQQGHAGSAAGRAPAGRRRRARPDG